MDWLSVRVRSYSGSVMGIVGSVHALRLGTMERELLMNSCLVNTLP